MGKEQLGKLAGRTSDRTEERMDRFRSERNACYLQCLCLGFGDDRRGMSGSGNVSLTIFITSMSGTKSFTSFAYIFPFRRSPGLRLVFDVPERNGKFGRIQYQRSREQQLQSKKKGGVFFCIRSNELLVNWMHGVVCWGRQSGEREGAVSRIGR